MQTELTVGLNLIHLGPTMGGLRSQLYSFVKNWCRYNPEKRLVAFYREDNAEAARLVALNPEITAVHVQSHTDINLHSTLYDVLYCPFAHIDPIPCEKPVVAFIPDIQERYLPENFSKRDTQNRNRIYEALKISKSEIITVSEFSRESLTEVLEFDPHKVHVIPHCTDLSSVANAISIPEVCQRRGFMLYPAMGWSHKNHRALLDSIAALREQSIFTSCILTGLVASDKEKIQQEIKDRSLEDCVFTFGRIKDEELLWLYRKSKMVVFPSLFEGFGLPVLEAITCHTPVVCADCCSLREVAGDLGEYFAPDDMNSHSLAIATAWSRREGHILDPQKVKAHLEKFRADRIVEAFEKVFLKAAGSPAPLNLPQQSFWKRCLARITTIPKTQLRLAKEHYKRKSGPSPHTTMSLRNLLAKLPNQEESTEVDRPLLSIITQGRNDGYMGNFMWRLATTLNKQTENILNLRCEDQVELILCDYGSQNPIVDELELTEETRRILKVVRVAPSLAKLCDQDSPYSFPHAVNTAIRIAQGKNIIFVDSDTYTTETALSQLLKALERGAIGENSLHEHFFMASRFHIPKQFHKESPSLCEIDDFIEKHIGEMAHDKINKVQFGGTATAYLMTREMWHECRSFDESMIHWGVFDIDLYRRLDLKYNLVDLEDEGIIFFHLEHYNDSKKRSLEEENPRKENQFVEITGITANNPFWGLKAAKLELGQQVNAESAADCYIAPEMEKDDVSLILEKIAKDEPLKNLLEIGSSSGEGSTASLVAGLLANTGAPSLHCIEVSKLRHLNLKTYYQDLNFIHAHHSSSVDRTGFATKDTLKAFFYKRRHNLKNFGFDRVCAWLEKDIAYFSAQSPHLKTLDQVKEEINGTIDFALIDGSEFTGNAELASLEGTPIIALDDITTFKCLECTEKLLASPEYKLLAADINTRNGYAIFQHRDWDSQLQDLKPIHFFTIVLNGMPFLKYHIEMLKHLPFPWVWHVIEGAAELVGDTAWGAQNGGELKTKFHHDGLSIDGTTEYLDQLAEEYPEQVKIYRKGAGKLWAGKTEMVNRPLESINEPALLWQIDSDEFWSFEQVLRMRMLFALQPNRTSAHFYCKFHISPNHIIKPGQAYANNPAYEWRRVWNYRPGDKWQTHEPPTLVRTQGDAVIDLSTAHPFSHEETQSHGLEFDHYAYSLESQLSFKEAYYGYKGALASWKKLANTDEEEVNVSDYLPWVQEFSETVLAVRYPAEDTYQTAIHEIGGWKFQPSELEWFFAPLSETSET